MAITYKTSLNALSLLKSNDYPHLSVADLHRGLYDYDFDKLSTDIEKNGITEPLLVTNDVLVDGHHRVIVAKELGLTEVQITYRGHLDKMPGDL